MKRIYASYTILFPSPVIVKLISLPFGKCAWALRSTFGEAINFVRLACVRHAASVRPEPGSNSRLIFLLLKLALSF